VPLHITNSSTKDKENPMRHNTLVFARTLEPPNQPKGVYVCLTNSLCLPQSKPVAPARQKVSVFDESFDGDEDDGLGNNNIAASHGQFIIPTSLRHPTAQAQASRHDVHGQNRADHFASSRQDRVVNESTSSHATRHPNVGGGGMPHASREDAIARVRRESTKKREADTGEHALSDEDPKVFSPHERRKAAAEQQKRPAAVPPFGTSSHGAASSSPSLMQNRMQFQREDRTAPNNKHVRDRPAVAMSSEEDCDHDEEEEYVPKKRKDVRGSKSKQRGRHDDFEFDSESDSDSDISDTELVRRPAKKKKASLPAKTSKNVASSRPKTNDAKNLARQKSTVSKATCNSSQGMQHMCVMVIFSFTFAGDVCIHPQKTLRKAAAVKADMRV
jgi:hypothetical protein